MASTGRALNKIFVSNLPWTIGHSELRTYFTEFGKVLNSNVVFDKKTGLSKGYGFIVFSNKQAIDNLANKPKHVLEGNTIFYQPSN
jgi:RNA recognition motif-containing protein